MTPASAARALGVAGSSTVATAASGAARRPRGTRNRADGALLPTPTAAERPPEVQPPVVADTRSRPAPPPDAAVEARPAGPASVREACGGRVFLSLAVCMERECEQPRFRNTPECLPILERKRQREGR